jgi:hypothetical protein
MLGSQPGPKNVQLPQPDTNLVPTRNRTGYHLPFSHLASLAGLRSGASHCRASVHTHPPPQGRIPYGLPFLDSSFYHLPQLCR